MKNDCVTKADLNETAGGLRQEMKSMRNDLHAEIVVFRNELHEEIASVRNEVHCLAVQVVQVSSDLNEFKQETRKNFDTVITSIDGLAGILTNIQTDMAATNHALLRHENRLDDYETRISVLEK